MSWRVAACVVAVALGSSSIGAAPPDRTTVLSVEDRAVVIATLPCATNLQSSSTGFVIDNQTVITVAHAIYESRDFAVRDVTGRWHQATVQHLDRETDVAVLRIPSLGSTMLPLRMADTDDAVRMVGGSASGTVDGSVVRRVRINTAIVGDLSTSAVRRGYELDVPIKVGDSGAAVIDDQDNVVGVVFARSKRSGASWAVSAAEVDVALDRRTVPGWECTRPSDARLVLKPLDEPE